MNKIEIKINATLENEVVVRNTLGLFASSVNCTIDDIIDIKTIVSENILIITWLIPIKSTSKKAYIYLFMWALTLKVFSIPDCIKINTKYI